ncbi:hypothetical protein [Sulfurimonas sp.]
MKLVYKFVFLLILIAFTGCGEGTSNKRISLMGADGTKVNPNSLAYVSIEKNEDRKNKIELSKIQANAKIEIAKIHSKNQLKIAEVNAQTQQKIAKSDSITKITTSKLDATTKKESMQYTVYIVIAVVVFLIIALILLYLNSKKNRELTKKLQEEKLKHEQILRLKELEEHRLHKILDLVAAGKLPSSIEEEVILSISTTKGRIITSA